MPLTIQQQKRNSFLGLAVCDALGAPLEFQARRNEDNYETEMVPNHNFGLPAGHFTDDTSMALCLANSLTEKGNDPIDQGTKYAAWWYEGYMSSLPGQSFDIGIQTQEALKYWQSPTDETLNIIAKKFSAERNCGNGSLMRVLPCALFAKSEEEAIDLAKQSSLVTHPHPRCVDACQIYCRLVFHALEGATKPELYEIIEPTDPGFEGRLKVRQKVRFQISSSGYVVDSLEAALWAFFNTDSFEDGAVEVINLGNDADTVGAIYGGLAGAFYEEIPDRWLKAMKSLDLVEETIRKF